jgi:hypothetical protein
MSDTGYVAPSHAKKRTSPLVALLALVAALGVFGAAFVYAGGVDYVNKLMGSAPAAPSGTPARPLASATPPTTQPTQSTTQPATSDVPSALGKRMYIEQIESAPQISRLRDGLTTMFTVDAVDKRSGTETWVAITAQFATEPRTMKGVMAFTSVGGRHYFLWIQDLTGAASTPQGLMATKKLTEPTEPTAEEFAEAGVTTVDQGVLGTVIASQAANQSLVAGLLDGGYKTVTLSAPITGPGTVTIPIKASGGSKPEASGSVKLVTKTIDGKDRTFVASFEAQ